MQQHRKVRVMEFAAVDGRRFLDGHSSHMCMMCHRRPDVCFRLTLLALPPAVSVQAWVLDTLPGEVRAGGPGRADHPADLIAALRRIPLPIADRNGVMDYLTQSGARA
jgi:hypothetical protein